MKNLDRQYRLYLCWPRYLAQWFAHEMYRLQHQEDEHLEPYQYCCDVEPSDLEAVDTRRGSAERNILEMCLTKQPDSIPELPSKDATICLLIPNFLNKPADTYNYLRPQGRELLEQTVRNHFRLELTKYMNRVLFSTRSGRASYKASNELAITAFMELNGIEYTDTNIQAIKTLWRRLYHYQYYKERNPKS